MTVGTNKLRLMQITHDLAIGGLQQVVVNLCRTIDKTKFDLSVLCLRTRGALTQEVEKMGIPVFSLHQKNNGTDYFSFMKVAKILRQEKIDIIHTHNTQPFIDGTIGALLSNVKTIVHTDHGRVFPDKKRYMLAERLMSHFAYKVVGVSDHTVENLKKYEGMPPSKMMVIRNGIDGSRYHAIIDSNKKRKELGVSNGGLIIGIAARLVKEKGITYLLKAMPAIIDAFPDITLVIAGSGHEENGLKKEAAELGISNNIRFVGSRRDVPDLLKLFDLFVLSSISEGLPLVLLEAMAAECPIVATNTGGVGTAIRHGENGSLVEPQNPSLLSSEIIKLLRNSKLRKHYAQKGVELFKDQFSAEIMTSRYERLYLREV